MEYSKIYSNSFKKVNVDIKKILNSLILENLKKLEVFKNIQFTEPFCLFFVISEDSKKIVRVDFNSKKVKLISEEVFDKEQRFYKVSAPGWLYKKVLDGDISWSDFSFGHTASGFLIQRPREWAI